MNLSWVLRLQLMNQLPHPYLLPLEFTLGTGLTRMGFLKEAAGILKNEEVLRRREAE